MKHLKKILILSVLIAATACSVKPGKVEETLIWDGTGKGSQYKRLTESHPLIYQTLEDASFFIEEFGTISMSTPILTEPDKAFKFDLSDKFNTDMYYNDAKSQLQGKASLLDQASLMMGIGASGKLDPTQTAAYFEKINQFKQTDAVNNSSAAISTDMQDTINAIAKDELSYALAEAKKIDSIDKRVAAIDAAISKYKERMSNASPKDNPYPSIDNDSNVPALDDPTRPAKSADRFTSDEFVGNRGLLSNDSLSLTDRIALTIAQGDNAMAAIFRTLGDAGNLSHYDKALYGVSLVSVNPGWRTSNNYNAKLTIIPGVEYSSASDATRSRYIEENPGKCESELIKPTLNRIQKKILLVTAIEKIQSERINKDLCKDFNIGELEEKNNVVGGFKYSGSMTAISPLSSSLILDLSFSKRDQLEFSLALALALRSAGQEVQAQAFLDYAKSIQSDFQTLSEENSITISKIGNELEIEVGPRFKAIKSAGQDNNAGRILERQTFPVLFMIGLTNEETKMKFVKAEGGVDLLEPAFGIMQQQNWSRNEKIGWLNKPKRDDEGTRMKLSDDLDKIIDHCNDPIASRVCYRAISLSNKIGGNFTYFKLPPNILVPRKKSTTPAVTKIIPSSVVLKKDANGKATSTEVLFTLIGSNLDKVDAKNIKFNTNFNNTQAVKHGDNAIQVQAKVDDSQSPIVFFLPYEVNTMKNSINTSALAVPVSIPEHKESKESKEKVDTYTFSSEVNGGKQTLIVPQSADKTILNTVTDVFKTEIEKNKKEPENIYRCCGQKEGEK